MIKKYILLLGCLLCIATGSKAADYVYTLRWEAPHTRTLILELETAPQTSSYTDFKIPVWRPGRYYAQDFAAAVSHFEAKAPGGTSLSWQKIDKDTWRVNHGELAKVKISYRFYADKLDAGSSYLGEDYVYFNGINLFMYVPDRLDDAVTLRVPDLPASWKIASSLRRVSGKNEFTASSYHELVDSPTIFAREMKQMQFEVPGVTFYVHFFGDYQGNRKTDQSILADLEKICREQMAVFDGFPEPEFHFIYFLMPYDFRHAVEHMKSTIVFRPASQTQSGQAARAMFGTTSHELWHVWNVKRIRPAAMLPYDYNNPPYTGLHWFTEGVTDYYGNLILARTGIIEREAWYSILARNIQNLENDYSTSQLSPYEASFDSWLSTSPYRHPYRQASYYPLGARVALLLDFAIRDKTNGDVSLDDVFRYLYINYYELNKGVPENGIQLVVERLTGSSWDDFFARYVNGVTPIDYKAFFKPMGLEIVIEEKDNNDATRLGITDLDAISQGWLIRKIHPAGDAYRDGLGVGDLIREINGESTSRLDPDTFFGGLKKGQTLRIQAYSDQQLKEVNIRYQGTHLPKRVTITESLRPKARQEKLLNQWLQTVTVE